MSPSIFIELNKIIACVTATLGSEYPTHFHHLRHAFATWWLARMLLPDDCAIPAFLGEAEIAWSSSAEAFGPMRTLRDRRPSRSNVFLVGRFLGHLHPSTTMSRYFHFSADLLRLHLDRSKVMRPDPELLCRVCAAAPNQAPGTPLPDGQLGAALTLLLQEAEQDRSEAPRGALRTSTRATASDNSLWIKRSLDLLRLVETPDGLIEYAATTVGVNLNEARAIVKAAEDLSALKTGNGAWRHRSRNVTPDLNTPDTNIRSIVPARACLPNDLAVISRFAARMQALHSDARTRTLLKLGVEAYVNSVWSSESYPVFHDPSRDGMSARGFLDLLRNLGIRLEKIRFRSFDPHERSRWTAP